MRTRSPRPRNRCSKNERRQAPIGACLFACLSGSACLERLFLPAGADHLRKFEDTAAGADRVRRRIHHRPGVLFTGLTLAALPITLLYIVLSKQFISGITHGAVK
ncbi:hypothetical protein RFM99_17510 [Mesorhizobium sp. VK4C]|uniref:hypothetical protein n=1 Tax=Mesorhizobium captivum TaxID=3072319 RepID=UPI002A24BC61|nr:hypothetical protein [Mesorhizobium sp. VK4C]MDX8500209.1 hypothetical protein [Mesorhizobium sp. VK4C]